MMSSLEVVDGLAEEPPLERECLMCGILKPLGQFNGDADSCIACGSLSVEARMKVARNSLSGLMEMKTYWRLSHEREKAKIVLAYGGKCACCGYDDFRFLSIDHVIPQRAHVRDGHKKERMTGRKLRSWIVKNNFPEGFQILCYNCNVAKGHREMCPHQMDRLKEAQA